MLKFNSGNVHPSLGLIFMQDLGVEEKRNGLVNLVQRGTSRKYKSGW